MVYKLLLIYFRNGVGATNIFIALYCPIVASVYCIMSNFVVYISYCCYISGMVLVLPTLYYLEGENK